MKKSLILILAVLLIAPLSSFALTSKYDKGVKVAKGPALEYESPDWFTPYPLAEAPENLDERLKILPYEEDQNEDMYIVLPTLGLIAPVMLVPEGSEDYTNMVGGREIDINKYLVDGVMHYAGSGMPGDVGNPVIFGHSNFFKKKPGRYKAIFADLMNLDVDPSDEIWIYTKKDDGEYSLRKFDIKESYETVPQDVEILRPKGGKKELTVFACTDGLNGRWILRGELIENNEILIPYEMKYKMHDIVNGMSAINNAKQESVVIEGVKKIEKIRASLKGKKSLTYHDKFKKYVLNYVETKLVEQY